MEHVVFYPSAEGVPAFERVNSLDAAVSFVEHLRNSQNITEFEVHSLIPVPLAFRAYYHVEVPGEAGLEESQGSDEPVAQAPAETHEDAAETATTDAVSDAATTPAQGEPEPTIADQVEAADEGTVEAETAPEGPAEPVAEDEAPDAEAPVAEASDAPADEDRSAEWVAEAPVVEPPVEVPASPAAETVPAAGPFADAPPVTPNESDSGRTDVVPVPTGRRSMGFFAR
jgi:hypothetical protein